MTDKKTLRIATISTTHEHEALLKGTAGQSQFLTVSFPVLLSSHTPIMALKQFTVVHLAVSNNNMYLLHWH